MDTFQTFQYQKFVKIITSHVYTCSTLYWNNDIVHTCNTCTCCHYWQMYYTPYVYNIPEHLLQRPVLHSDQITLQSQMLDQKNLFVQESPKSTKNERISLLLYNKYSYLGDYISPKMFKISHVLIFLKLTVHMSSLQILTYTYTFIVIIVHVVIVFFLGQFCPRGKGARRLTLCKEPTSRARPDHNTENYLHLTLFNNNYCGFFN